MKRVVVTGATGFIGRACLAPLIGRGFDVHALAHARASDSSPVGVTWHDCDLLAGDGVAALIAKIAPTHLVHLAWYAVPGKYWTARENLAWVRASLALYEAFVAAGGRRFVGGGTSAEYDWARLDEGAGAGARAGVCHEGATPLGPRTYYGTCKHALAQIVLGDAARAGVSAAWARFFFLFGPHEHPDRLVSSVIRALLRGAVARCSPGSQERDFLAVDDAGAAIAALADADVGGAINVGSGVARSVRSIVERIAAQIGGDAPARVDLGARPADPSEPPRIVADVGRLRDEVGFPPARDFDERLRETIAWWRAHPGSLA